MLFDTLLKFPFREKAHTPLTGLRGFHPLAPKIIRKINPPTDFLLLATLTQDLPDFSLGSVALNQEEFDLSAGRFLPAQAGRDNPGIVQDQHTVLGNRLSRSANR